MAYLTTFFLTIENPHIDRNAVIKALNKVMDVEDEDSIFAIDDDVIYTDPVPWYDHDIECAQMSTVFPGVLFKLHGEGDSPSDLWDAYYIDNQCQICRAQISYPSFNAEKLKSVYAAQEEDSLNLMEPEKTPGWRPT